MSTGKLILRVVVGSVFAAHGLQKLRGVWGGPGLEGTAKMMESVEMHPPAFNARLVALTETVGGIAIVAGIATPFAAAGLIATMATAVRKVHWKNGPWNSNRGYEYNVLLTAGLLAIVDDGPGILSVDAVVGKSRWGFANMIFALGAGLAGSLLAVELGRKDPVVYSSDDQDYNVERSTD
jgi:putative oxidoreductase